MKDLIARLVRKEDLSQEEAARGMTLIMEGRATEAQIAAFLMGLRLKGETSDEITGCARVMRQKALRIDIDREVIDLDRDDINVDRETIIDTCGTGGDGTNTFNVSTATAFVVAGAGCLVAKHGNRSVSSSCGSADVVRSLGINLDLEPAEVKQCVEKVGIGFFYAPLYHSAMKFALPVRVQLGIRTIFNLLGPLSNPAGANVQVMGVYSRELTTLMAEVLRNLGCRSALVVYGEGSFDEISIVGRTFIAHLKEGAVSNYQVSPEDFGFAPAGLETIRGGSAEVNARIILEVLGGTPGPRRNMVLMNAAAVFLAAGRVADWKAGIALAGHTIDSGQALGRLEALIEFTNRFAVKEK
ncbi:MAG TPA: anthranilate phosphoribosyltransferase [bacterium]|uniref:Anthranilate phosphoribosyltransferase n=1 Tax=candidate division TA06 bacterium ADurb.Bin417 TaxID=1852828 RepID=A0A1V5MKP7_UNCT6|nr:MAG: Anthranilate phosphoribosyltransferase [candidate division TA06 bacterium ADurb.Bin417]HNQ35008.1 anthranilate phosphoribosyltransferase [bacterium]HNS48551.1 anthranilate phosphoribosyltransferase [bacterium]